MADDLKPDKCAEYLRALAEPVRLQIVDRLRFGPGTVSEIAEFLGTELQNASHHLRVMSHAGLLVRDRDGRYVRYSIDPDLFQAGHSKTPDALNFGCCRIELGPVQVED